MVVDHYYLNKAWEVKISSKVYKLFIIDDLCDRFHEGNVLLNQNYLPGIENQYKNVKILCSGSNLGYGAGNNFGLSKVKTKYALILNPDATLHPSALENFIRTTEKISEFAIMGPYIQEKKNSNDKNYLKNIISNPKILKILKFQIFKANFLALQDTSNFYYKILSTNPRTLTNTRH